MILLGPTSQARHYFWRKRRSLKPSTRSWDRPWRPKVHGKPLTDLCSSNLFFRWGKSFLRILRHVGCFEFAVLSDYEYSFDWGPTLMKSDWKDPQRVVLKLCSNCLKGGGPCWSDVFVDGLFRLSIDYSGHCGKHDPAGEPEITVRDIMLSQRYSHKQYMCIKSLSLRLKLLLPCPWLVVVRVFVFNLCCRVFKISEGITWAAVLCLKMVLRHTHRAVAISQARTTPTDDADVEDRLIELQNWLSQLFIMQSIDLQRNAKNQ